METLNAKQQEILNACMNEYAKNRVKLILLKDYLSEENLIVILKHINNSIKDKNPKYVQFHADGKNCTIFNSIGFMLKTNIDVKDYKHLEIKNWKNNESIYSNYCQARKTLTEKLARLKKLPIFQNGNLYAKTKAEINKLINN
jgi:hypothetical protein